MQKWIGHTATDDELVSEVQQVHYQFDFISDFGTSQYAYDWSFGLVDKILQIVNLSFQQKT